MKKRTSCPSKGNKFYITRSSGGYSECIKGKPTNKYCDVLSNCVGYACGRFNEIVGAMLFPQLNCNAENFIERAKSIGLCISNKPTLGGIMVWQKGNSLKGSDGAGHVEVVEEIINDNTIYTSGSNYGGSSFFNMKRYNNNGRWGLSSSYKFRGCIINPVIKKPSFLPNKGYFEFGDTSDKIDQISRFMRKTFPLYTRKEAVGPYFGKNIRFAILEFQKITKIARSGKIDGATLNKLKYYGFKY